LLFLVDGDVLAQLERISRIAEVLLMATHRMFILTILLVIEASTACQAEPDTTSDVGAGAPVSSAWIEVFGSRVLGSARGITELSDGTLVVGGSARSDDALYLFVDRLDDRGHLLWQVTSQVPAAQYRERCDPRVESRSVIKASNGDIVQLGAVGGCCDVGCLYDAHLVRYAPNGSVRWRHAYASTTVQDNWNDGAHALAELRDGSLVFTDADETGARIVRVGADGTLLSQHALGPTTLYPEPFSLWSAASITQRVNDLVVVGTHTTDFLTQIWVGRLDTDGGVLEQTTYDLPPRNWGGIAYATVSADGAVTIAHTELVLHIDAAGAPKWMISLGSTRIVGLAPSHDGGFVVVGKGPHPPSFSVVAELNNEGDIEWQRALGYRNSTETYYSLSLLDAIATSSGATVVAGGVFTSDEGNWLVAKLDARDDLESKSEMLGPSCPELFDPQLVHDVHDVETITATTAGTDAIVVKTDDLTEVEGLKGTDEDITVESRCK